MRKFAFISRHQPTTEQQQLAQKADIELVVVGDRDGFKVDPKEFDKFDGVVVVHAGMALRLVGFTNSIGVFENTKRLGDKPEFFASALHLFEMPVTGEGVWQKTIS